MTDNDDKFYIETLSADHNKWIQVADQYLDEKKGFLRHKALSFDSFEKACKHAKNLNTVFRVKVVTFYYGDFVMPKSVLKLLDGKGYQVKGVKGIDPRKTFKNEGEFAEAYQDLNALNAIGISLVGASKWETQADPTAAQSIIWEGISKLTVNAQEPRAPREGVTYRFNVKDPTIWADAPKQVKNILDRFHRDNVEEIKSSDVKTVIANMVETGELKCRQDDPMKVFAYYVSHKKRGFKSFGALVA